MLNYAQGLRLHGAISVGLFILVDRQGLRSMSLLH